LGIDLERLAVVPSPGAKWAAVVAALLEDLDVVLLCPPGRVGQPDARRLEARARERGSVLAVLGGPWPVTTDVRLEVVVNCWRGLEDGPGYLAGRHMEVVASGRGAASRQRSARLWLGPPQGAFPLEPPGRIVVVRSGLSGGAGRCVPSGEAATGADLVG
jgi:hypothetical protein